MWLLKAVGMSVVWGFLVLLFHISWGLSGAWAVGIWVGLSVALVLGAFANTVSSRESPPTSGSDAQTRLPVNEVPNGVELSRNVIELPRIDSFLLDLMYRANNSVNVVQPLIADGLHGCHWVKRGEKLGRLLGLPEENAIVSPVTGLLLYHTGSIATWSEHSSPKILLQSGEIEPLPVDQMLRDLPAFFLDNIKVLRRKLSQSPYAGMSAEQLRADIERALERQMRQSYKFSDMKNENWERDWYPEQFPNRPDIMKALKPVIQELY